MPLAVILPPVLLKAPLILSAFGPSKLPLMVRVPLVGSDQDALKPPKDGAKANAVSEEDPVGIREVNNETPPLE